jgi:hypothetical protein
MGGDPKEDGQPTFLSVYAHTDIRCCNFPVTSSTDELTFYVFGKRVEDEYAQNEFKIISTIKLPFDEVITVLKTKQLSNELIPSCFLELNYEDNSIDSPYPDRNTIELKF